DDFSRSAENFDNRSSQYPYTDFNSAQQLANKKLGESVKKSATDYYTTQKSLADAFEALRNAHEQVVDAHIVSAFPLDALQQQSLMDVLRAKYGKQVKLSVEVDESLIGGVVIQIGDEVMDASIRGKVSQLADALR
ncbi:MAG: ATP synthase F1 subunit delta, partial [Betaproteobacteria bacterium]|nr:ATP synthase F1 subunit delta [Betaproteobacteria bacterium]